MFIRNLKHPFVFGLIICLLSTLAGIAPLRLVAAQGAKTVTYDTPVESQIADSGAEETWSLTASAKDRIAITVERTSGTLIPKIELRDSNNQRMTSADNDPTFARAIMDRIDVPKENPEVHGLSIHPDGFLYCDATSGWVVKIST